MPEFKSNRSKCNKCGAWLTWATDSFGKKRPFDDQPFQGRQYVIIGDQAGFVTTCHFDTCANKGEYTGKHKAKQQEASDDDIPY